MRKIVEIIGFCLIAWGASAQIPVDLQTLLNSEGLKNAAIGISVKSVPDGKEVLAYCPGVALTPASVTKLIPAWLALQEKGEKFRYSTPVYYTGTIKEGQLQGNIVVMAGGDPTLESRYFPDYSLINGLTEAIRKAGIRKIQGNICVEGAKAALNIPGSWLWEDVSNYYAALYLPFNYRDNTYTLHFRSGQAGTPADLVTVIPDIPGVSFRNEVKAARTNRDNAWIFGGPYADTLCIKGTIPSNRADFKVKGAMSDPVVVFVREAIRELLNKNIQVEQQVVEQVGKTLLFKWYSPPLEEIIFRTNKFSINLFAEALGDLATQGKGPERVKTRLLEGGINADGIILKDACGLSPVNAIPAEVMTDLLVYASRQKKTAFLRSLPVGGTDNGLAGYCHAFPQLKQRLFAKTGSMSGVRCLAGYLTRKNGQQLAFTILINHYTCSVSQLQQAVGEFLNSLL